jgi:hypothetical protein
MNRLLKAGAEIAWIRDEVTLDTRRLPAGAILVSRIKTDQMTALARELRLQVQSLSTSQARLATVGALPIRAPRIAVYEPWGGNIDAGWTRWVLEQHEFPYLHARNADLQKPNLLERFDVLVLPEITSNHILRGNQGRNIPEEYRGGIGTEGVHNIREFIRNGGTVVSLGNTAQFAMEYLEAPLRTLPLGSDGEAFYCPGSLLRIQVDPKHPLGFGMPTEADAMFINNSALLPASSANGTTTVVARYPDGAVLRSGWVIGEQKLRGGGAVLESVIGRGRVIVHAFRVQNRGQTWGTFKLLFNSIFYGPAAAGQLPALTTQ